VPIRFSYRSGPKCPSSCGMSKSTQGFQARPLQDFFYPLMVLEPWLELNAFNSLGHNTLAAEQCLKIHKSTLRLVLAVLAYFLPIQNRVNITYQNVQGVHVFKPIIWLCVVSQEPIGRNKLATAVFKLLKNIQIFTRVGSGISIWFQF
jgi:hypothetical protein